MEKLDLFIEKYRLDNRIAGLSVSVTDKNATLYSKGFGAESTERPEIGVTGDTLFRIASITKVFTGITVLRLCEMGVLTLDTPIKEYLPYLKLENAEAERTLTMRHLLSHTAGLPAEYTPKGPKDEGMLKEVLMRELPKLNLIGLPGEKYLYSNWGIRLASLVITELTGKPYSEVCYELLINPLGLKNTTFFSQVAMTYPFALPHVTDDDGNLKVLHEISENATRLATGGLYSSASDLAIFGRMILCGGITDSGERIISAESLALMREWISTSKTGNGYGLTTTLYPTEDGFFYGHKGNANPYLSILLYDLENSLSVAVLINTNSPTSPEVTAKSILKMLKEKYET